VSIAFIRDHQKNLVRLRELPVFIIIMVMLGLVWVRVRRRKREILGRTLGGALGAALSGFLVGLFLGLTLAFYRQSTTYEATTLVLVLTSLGTVTGLLAGFGISFGMSSMRSIGYRHSPYWAIPGAMAGGALIGGFLNLIGVDILRALFGQDLSGLAGAYEVALIGLGLSLGYLLRKSGTSRINWWRILTAALGAMLAAILLNLIKGNLFSASIETIAHSFANSQINLQVLAKLFGEDHFGQISRLVLGAFEGFLFGGCLVLGMEIWGKKYPEPTMT
jgi:hypothetical protein